jgi:hypothetical protein
MMLRRDQQQVKVYVDEDVRKELKMYAIKNDTSIQSLLEEYIYQLIHKKGEK